MILLKNKDKKANIKIGNNIEIKDGNDFPFDLTLYGRSTQETTTGKNLLNNTLLTTITEINGITATPNSDGSVSQILSSNATFDGNFVVKAEVQEGTLFEANQRITKEKRLQTGFGG